MWLTALDVDVNGKVNFNVNVDVNVMLMWWHLAALNVSSRYKWKPVRGMVSQYFIVISDLKRQPSYTSSSMPTAVLHVAAFKKDHPTSSSLQLQLKMYLQFTFFPQYTSVLSSKTMCLYFKKADCFFFTQSNVIVSQQCSHNTAVALNRFNIINEAQGNSGQLMQHTQLTQKKDWLCFCWLPLLLLSTFSQPRDKKENFHFSALQQEFSELFCENVDTSKIIRTVTSFWWVCVWSQSRESSEKITST